MSQPPTPYNRIFDFESFSIVNPTTQQPGVQIEGELDAIKTTLTSTISRLSEIQRDDGYLRDSSLDQSTIIPYFFNKLDILFQPVFLKKAGGEMDDAATILWSQTTTLPTNTVSTAVSLNNTVIQGALTYTADPQYLQPWPVSLQHPFGYWNGGTYSDVRKTTTSKGVIELVRYGVGMNTSAPLAITPIGNITISAGEISGPTSGGIFPDYGSAPTPHIDISDIRNGTISISAYGIVFKDGTLQTTRGMPQNEVAQYVTAEVSSAIAGVNASITALIGAAPAALNTLSEIADAINDDANIATTLTNAISLKLATATAALTYQPLSGMSSYLTTATAASTYYPQTNPTGYITSSALSSYLTTATASSTYQTVSGMSSYLTTSTASTTYAPISVISGDRYLTSSVTSNTISNTNKTFTIGTGLSYTPTQNITISYNAANHMHGEVLTYNSSTGVLTVDINNHTGSGTYSSWVVNVGGVTPVTPVAWGAVTGTLSSQTDLNTALGLKAPLASPTFTGDPKSVTPATSDNDTSIATTAFVKAQDYATNAAISAASFLTTSAAASTYYLQTNPSGFISDAPSDGSQYARKNAAWEVVSGGGGGGSGPWVYLGAYNGGTTYAANNYITYNGSGYVMTNTIGAAGYDPIGYPGSWQLVASIGDTGTTGPAGPAGMGGAMNYLDMLTVTSSSAGYYESGGSWSAYYGFMNNSGGWFYNKLNASGVTFKLYINGVYDSSGTGAYNYMSSSGTLVTTPVSGDVVTIFVSDGTNEASIPLVTITI